MFNNAHILSSLGRRLDDPTSIPGPSRRGNISPEPCLPERLPATSPSSVFLGHYNCVHIVHLGFIQREAESLAPRELIKQLRRTPSPELPSEEPSSPRSILSSDSESEDSRPPRTRTASISSVWSSLSSAVSASHRLGKQKEVRAWKAEVSLIGKILGNIELSIATAISNFCCCGAERYRVSYGSSRTRL